MKGYLIDKNGALTLLPEFLSWDVCHGMGEPCDWFEVSFIYYSAQLPKLPLPLPRGAQQRRRVQGNNRRIQHKHRRKRLGRYALGPIGRGAAAG